MTLEQAIEEVQRAGSLGVVGDAIRYEIRDRSERTAEALATLKARKPEALAILSNPADPKVTSQSLESVLAGNAIELWSTTAGRLFLVADEGDARQATERFGAHRGEIYTAAEVRRVVQIADPATVAELHRWKREFNGSLRAEGQNLV